MDVTVNRELLKESIGIAKIAQGTGGTNEWTKGLKMRAFTSPEGNGSIALSSTDGNTSIDLCIDAEVRQPGEILIDGVLINKLVDCYIDENIIIKLDGDISIQCGRDNGDYKPMKVDDFVNITTDDNDTGWFKIPVSLITDADTKVRFAAADYSSAKPQMSSVYLILQDGKIEMAACDGCKLAYLKNDVSQDLPNFSILIPSEGLGKIAKAIREYSSDENIDINIKEDRVYVRVGRLLMDSLLVSGKYINYKKIVPSNFVLGITFDRKELMRKVQIADAANTCSPDGSQINDVAIKMTNEGFGQGFATIVNAKNVANTQVGEIPFTTEYGEIKEDWALWVDTTYALQVLKNISCDAVQIDIENPNIPFRIKGKDSEDYICVVMPKQHKKKKD